MKRDPSIMKNERPVIGITMGDPVGVGPEIIIQSLSKGDLFEHIRPIVIGDMGILERARDLLQSDIKLNPAASPDKGVYHQGTIDVIPLSTLKSNETLWGKPTEQTGRAMTHYILKAIDLAMEGQLAAVVTCPINKLAMNMAGYHYNGHTELFAERTQTRDYAMMLAGERLRVVLVTIHMPFVQVAKSITVEKIVDLILLTERSLKSRFGIDRPRIAVAGLNPHAGEEGMFGTEEKETIAPAIDRVRSMGIDVKGPFPPDTIYYHAVKGAFDVVVSMYHDQGLIPFKLIHFENGVNTTLGLPIIRTSVDHGTAYDIAGTGKANPESLISAMKMAASQVFFSQKSFRP
jgi:4-hydroxythreonine-4-phosphate dehydrogenase